MRIIKTAFAAFLLLAPVCVMAADFTFLQQNSQPKYMLEDPDQKGLCGDLYTSISKRLAEQGFSVEIPAHYLPIKRIFALVESTPGNVFCGATRTPERLTRFRYSSVPLYRVSNVLLARADDPVNPASYQELRSLGETVGALYGTSSTRVLKRELGDLVNESFTDLNAPMKLIGAPPYRLRYFYYHDLGLNYIVKNSPYPLRVIPTKFRSFEQWFIYNPETPVPTIDAIEAVIHEMKVSGELDTIVGRYIY